MQLFKRFADQEWQREFKSDFAFLRRIPSHDVAQALAVYRQPSSGFGLDDAKAMADGTLSPERRLAFFDSCRFVIDVPCELKPAKEQRYAILGMLGTISHTLALGFTEEQWAEVLTRHGTSITDLQQRLAEVEADPAAGASDVRKAWFPKLSSRLGCKPTNEGGGNWEYAFSFKGHEVNLCFDFGGMHPGFRSELRFLRDGISFNCSYLTMLGFLDPYWDMIRIKSVGQACEVFIETLDRALAVCEAEGFWAEKADTRETAGPGS